MKIPTIILLALSIFLLGAACAKSTTTSTSNTTTNVQNTNVVSTQPNSHTTGSFETSPATNY